MRARANSISQIGEGRFWYWCREEWTEGGYTWQRMCSGEAPTKEAAREEIAAAQKRMEAEEKSREGT